jgi:hypothetical protein
MWLGERILGFWLPFVGFRNEIPPPSMGLSDTARPAFVIEWFGLGLRLFWRAKPRSGR